MFTLNTFITVIMLGLTGVSYDPIRTRERSEPYPFFNAVELPPLQNLTKQDVHFLYNHFLQPQLVTDALVCHLLRSFTEGRPLYRVVFLREQQEALEPIQIISLACQFSSYTPVAKWV